ncbi:MAG TPA: LamG domain-containing protein [Actinomycetes bacterium]|nr:LamG domain-containing protein [Actinomycetes bacterium]
MLRVRTAIALCLAGVAALGLGGQAAAAPSTNLVLRYTFELDSTSAIQDSSSHGLTGTLQNADPSAAFVTEAAQGSKALQLVADERQYVSVPENDVLDVNRFTLMAWVRYSGVTTPETRGRWEVLEKAGAYWVNVRTDGHVRAGGFFGGCVNSQYWVYFDSTTTIPANTWTHVAARYNGSRLAIFIDGQRAGSVAVSGTTCANNEPLAVGAKNAPAKGILEAFWDGQLDDVRIYDKALTPRRIASIGQ